MIRTEKIKLTNRMTRGGKMELVLKINIPFMEIAFSLKKAKKEKEPLSYSEDKSSN